MQSKSPQELTQARLKELLEFEPETGVFRWKVSRGFGPTRRNPGDVAGAVYGNGSHYIVVDRQSHPSHRLAFLWMTGAWPDHDVDHINGDRLDNRWINMRPASRKENMHNRGRANKNNKSGLLGVSWSKQKSKWIAQIMADGRAHYVGLFPTPELAHAAYLKAKDELHPTHMRLRDGR